MSMVTIQECVRVMEVGLDWSPDASVSNGFSPPLSPYTYKQGVWDFQRRLDTCPRTWDYCAFQWLQIHLCAYETGVKGELVA